MFAYASHELIALSQSMRIALNGNASLSSVRTVVKLSPNGIEDYA